MLEHVKEKAVKFFSLLSNRKRVVEAVRGAAAKVNGKIKEDDASTFLTMSDFSKELEFFVHPSPLHSIGHFHVHILLRSMRTSHLYDFKNLPLDHVIEYLHKLV